ncbi:MAG: methylenetetrahydrofolate reductase [Actinobacteria bacterium]|nr:methylenetetrahydrofolate reductase [Actinomycetota bacterium]
MNDRPSIEAGSTGDAKASTSLFQADEGQVLADLLKRSALEIFPTPLIERRLDALAEGTQVTITCSPARGIAETLALSEKLSSRGLRVIPHISARLVRDDAHLQEIVGRLASMQAAHLFVIGGDVKKRAGKFPSTLSLLSAIADMDHPFVSIGVAGYPEGHPFLEDNSLVETLKAKEPLATYVVTQLCFDPGAIVGWIENIRGQGIGLPVHIGLPGVTQAHRLLRFALKIGVGNSARFLTKHSNLVMQLAKSSYNPDDLLRDLAPRLGESAMRIEGFHLYTFNEVAATKAWRDQLVKDLEASKAIDVQRENSNHSTKGARHADSI